MTPDEIEEFRKGVWGLLTGKYDWDPEKMKALVDGVCSQANCCAKAEAELEDLKHDVGRLMDVVVAENQATGKYKAQRDALTRVIMEIKPKAAFGEYDDLRNQERGEVARETQTKLQQILGPDWKDPLEELYKLIMDFAKAETAEGLILLNRTKEIVGEALNSDPASPKASQGKEGDK